MCLSRRIATNKIGRAFSQLSGHWLYMHRIPIDLVELFKCRHTRLNEFLLLSKYHLPDKLRLLEGLIGWNKTMKNGLLKDDSWKNKWIPGTRSRVPQHRHCLNKLPDAFSMVGAVFPASHSSQSQRKDWSEREKSHTKRRPHGLVFDCINKETCESWWRNNEGYWTKSFPGAIKSQHTLSF